MKASPVKVEIWGKIPDTTDYNDKGPGRVGEDFYRDSDWKPIVKTKKGWEQLAKQRSAKTRWTPFVVWVPDRGYYRINMGGI